MEMLRQFYEEEDGMGTVEMVMIIAALMCIALLFRKSLTTFVKDIMDKIFKPDFVEDPTAGVK